MTEEWQIIIDSLRFVKPEAVKKDQLLKKLNEEYTYDLTTIDSLYLLKILTKEEYLHYLERVKNQAEINANFIERIIKRIKQDEKEGKEYDPNMHYCCYRNNSYGLS